MFEDLGLKYVGPGRRPRHRGRRARAAPGQAASAARSSCTASPEGPRLPAGRGRRGRPLPRRRRDRPGDRPAARRAGTVVDLRLRATRWSRSARERPDVVGITAAMLHPGRAGQVRRGVPGPGLRRRHRRAARDDLRRRAGDRRPAPGGRGLRDLPQPRLRPGADGRRAAQVRRDLRARPGRRHRRRTAPATTACGTCRSCRSCPACGSPRRATRDRCARSCARRSPSTTRRPWSASRRGRSAPTSPPSTASAAWTCCAATAERRATCCWSSVGAMAAICLEVAERCAQQGIGVTVVDPRWVKPVDAALVGLAAEHRCVVTVEDNVPGRRRRRRRRPGAARRRVGDAAARLRHPAAVPRPRQARRGAGRDRAHRRRRSPARSSRRSRASRPRSRPGAQRRGAVRLSAPRGRGSGLRRPHRGMDAGSTDAATVDDQLPGRQLPRPCGSRREDLGGWAVDWVSEVRRTGNRSGRGEREDAIATNWARGGSTRTRGLVELATARDARWSSRS